VYILCQIDWYEFGDSAVDGGRGVGEGVVVMCVFIIEWYEILLWTVVGVFYVCVFLIRI
jgi:hypothetical protein